VNLARVVTFVAAVLSVWLATGLLKHSGRLAVGDARKLNHIFALAGGALWFGWLPEGQARWSGRVACGILVMLIVVVCRMRRHRPFSYAFLANTRVSDAPHEAFHFWFSWSISMASLLAIDLVLADVVVTRTAALLVGIGDGVGEPFGVRFGRHRYRVPCVLAGERATRSIEGSLAVVFASMATVLLCFGSPSPPDWARALTAAVIVGLTIGIVEAVSPHGLDNLTIPISSAVLLSGLRVMAWI
jgi:dolichol kinase